MFTRIRITKAQKKAQEACLNYDTFLKEMIDMGYGEMTDAELREIGREDLVQKDEELRGEFLRAVRKFMMVAYRANI